MAFYGGDQNYLNRLAQDQDRALRSQQTLAKCDQCGAIAEFVLASLQQPPVHFCGLRCLREWAAGECQKKGLTV